MAEDESKQEGKGFVVQDRRRFSETGEARSEPAESTEKVEAPSQPGEATARPAPESHAHPLPEINFSTFIISLSTQALMHLGEIADPVSGRAETDLAGAKQMIDILS